MSDLSISNASAISDPTTEQGHGSSLAHHFDTPQQQFDAGKLGMWIFLVTEVLFFGGLFVAYAVYRSNHPEVFVYAHQFLDKTLGALNTVVLLLSSLTMAWAVRCAQLDQRKGLIWCLVATLVCAGFFLGVKAVEYSTKWDEGLLWAGAYAPQLEHAIESFWTRSLFVLSLPGIVGLPMLLIAALVAKKFSMLRTVVVCLTMSATCGAFLLGVGTGRLLPRWQQSLGVASHDSVAHAPTDHTHDDETAARAGVFFSIYYGMTGVHAIHIFAGMGVLAWILSGSVGGRFTSKYFAPVDFVGLYWHLVDLVWIFLFPLLYLIH